MRSLALRVGGFLLVLSVWSYALDTSFTPATSALIAVGGCLASLVPIVLGRLVLDTHPTAQRARWATALVHYDLMVLMGPAIIEAVQSSSTAPQWPLSVPLPLGFVLFLLTGTGLMLTISDLALRGVGAPFALALSQRLAVGGTYAWTRNPMLLAAFFCLLSLGLWLRSGLFLVWALGVLAPVMVVFVLVYEERELELRFGDPYLAYKARTPLLWPRRPRAVEGETEWT